MLHFKPSVLLQQPIIRTNANINFSPATAEELNEDQSDLAAAAAASTGDDPASFPLRTPPPGSPSNSRYRDSYTNATSGDDRLTTVSVGEQQRGEEGRPGSTYPVS